MIYFKLHVIMHQHNFPRVNVFTALIRYFYIHRNIIHISLPLFFWNEYKRNKKNILNTSLQFFILLSSYLIHARLIFSSSIFNRREEMEEEVAVTCTWIIHADGGSNLCRWWEGRMTSESQESSYKLWHYGVVGRTIGKTGVKYRVCCFIMSIYRDFKSLANTIDIW